MLIKVLDLLNVLLGACHEVQMSGVKSAVTNPTPPIFFFGIKLQICVTDGPLIFLWKQTGLVVRT